MPEQPATYPLTEPWETDEDAARWPVPRYAPWWDGSSDRWWREMEDVEVAG